MIYTVKFSNRALNDLMELREHTAAIILSWVRKHLEGCEDPRSKGEGVIGAGCASRKYRIGVYRLLVEIQDETITVLCVNGLYNEE